MSQMSITDCKNVCKLIRCYPKTMCLPWGYLSLRSTQDWRTLKPLHQREASIVRAPYTPIN